MKAAVIGIGSNSVRCLLAETEGGDFSCLWRDREGTRLFAVSRIRRQTNETRFKCVPCGTNTGGTAPDGVLF